MKRIVKRAVVCLMAAGLSFGIIWTGTEVKAGERHFLKEKQTRYIQPEEWNPAEIKAYQFDSSDEYDGYLLSGGMKYFNKNFKKSDRMVKIQIVDSGYFVLLSENEDQTDVVLYDKTKKKVLSRSTKDDDMKYSTRVKAGEVFYVKMPEKVNHIILMPAVMKESFGAMKAENTYYQAGTGAFTYHPFSVSKRSAVEITISSLLKNGGATEVFLEKYTNGRWKKIASEVKLNYSSKDDSFVYGLASGRYRMALRSGTRQLVSASYSKMTVKKKVSFKKSKANVIKLEKNIYNLYTSKEKAARWYRIQAKAEKNRRELSFGKDTVSGGYRFTIYRKGRKKPVRTVKVKSNINEKIVKLPKKRGTYYIKVSKLTDDTNGIYEIGYY